MTKLLVPWIALIAANSVANAFAPLVPTPTALMSTTALCNYESTVTEEQLNHKLEAIAHKLRLQVYDMNTGVYGLESKDHAYGIENIRCTISVDPALGVELTEVAHAAGSGDARGLVLVSGVTGNAAEHSAIQVGDTIVGVFCKEADFAESVTGFNYEDTMETIARAKTHAHMMMDEGGASITLEVNRLVPRAKVAVIVEGVGDEPQVVEGLAGDNLRMLLMHHDINIYSDRLHRLDMPGVTNSNCGGDGICATCMVEILDGSESMSKMGPKEQEITSGRPSSWRAACQTVLGRNNQEGSVRIRVHPQWLKDGHEE